MAVRLLIADDHEVVRAGLKSLLAAAPEVQVVGEAADGAEALRLSRRHRPDVALLDVRMPQADGLAVLAQLRAERPATAIVMFSSYDNPTYIGRAMALGAVGYLLKSASGDAIIQAVRRAAAGETLWSSESRRQVSAALATERAPAEIDAPLTKREAEVLRHMALGLSNKEIAQALEITADTVKEHVQHILKKLALADRTQAAVWAVRMGIV